MLLSIIIPVYNVERYIVETLESILSQNTFPFTYEVIVVNDGTPDHSMEIVERYRYSFDNLTIINQENQGLSCARNSGLKIAKGDYVWFIDSDDSIPQDAFESLFPYLTRYRHEVLAFDITKIEEETGKKLTEKIFLKPKYYHLYNTSHNGTELNKKISSARASCKGVTSPLPPELSMRILTLSSESYFMLTASSPLPSHAIIIFFVLQDLSCRLSILNHVQTGSK